MVGAEKWVKQACEGIGGTEVNRRGQYFDDKNVLIGALYACLCARGSTSPHEYSISGDFPPGSAVLNFDATEQFWCQSMG